MGNEFSADIEGASMQWEYEMYNRERLSWPHLLVAWDFYWPLATRAKVLTDAGKLAWLSKGKRTSATSMMGGQGVTGVLNKNHGLGVWLRCRLSTPHAWYPGVLSSTQTKDKLWSQTEPNRITKAWLLLRCHNHCAYTKFRGEFRVGLRGIMLGLFVPGCVWNLLRKQREIIKRNQQIQWPRDLTLSVQTSEGTGHSSVWD